MVTPVVGLVGLVVGLMVVGMGENGGLSGRVGGEGRAARWYFWGKKGWIFCLHLIFYKFFIFKVNFLFYLYI